MDDREIYLINFTINRKIMLYFAFFSKLSGNQFEYVPNKMSKANSNVNFKILKPIRVRPDLNIRYHDLYI